MNQKKESLTGQQFLNHSFLAYSFRACWLDDCSTYYDYKLVISQNNNCVLTTPYEKSKRGEGKEINRTKQSKEPFTEFVGRRCF